MKRDNKKALYESIMASVAKEVKKALNENQNTIEYKPNDYNTLIVPNGIDVVEPLHRLISKYGLEDDECNLIEDICGSLSTYYSLYRDLKDGNIEIIVK